MSKEKRVAAREMAATSSPSGHEQLDLPEAEESDTALEIMSEPAPKENLAGSGPPRMRAWRVSYAVDARFTRDVQAMTEAEAHVAFARANGIIVSRKKLPGGKEVDHVESDHTPVIECLGPVPELQPA